MKFLTPTPVLLLGKFQGLKNVILPAYNFCLFFWLIFALFGQDAVFWDFCTNFDPLINFDPLMFSNDQLLIILKRRNLEICEHSSFQLLTKLSFKSNLEFRNLKIRAIEQLRFQTSYFCSIIEKIECSQIVAVQMI